MQAEGHKQGLSDDFPMGEAALVVPHYRCGGGWEAEFSNSRCAKDLEDHAGQKPGGSLKVLPHGGPPRCRASAYNGSLDIESIFAAQRAAWLADPYPFADQRRESLDRLLSALLERQEELVTAVDRDFGGRARMETLIAEVFTSANAVRYARRRVKSWMKPRRRHVAWPLQPARAYVLPQPLGVVGILAPWNYPIFLTIPPLAGALAAGNRVMLKPSEYTPETSQALARLVESAFPPGQVAVIQGNVAVGRSFAALPFDHLLFTGSTAVGRDIMRIAGERLTPVTLELGGKSPAVVAADANLVRAARDIVYGKLLNAGQTCIAPDYVLIPASRLRPFIDAVKEAVRAYFPEDAGWRDYASIIHQRHYDRLQSYVGEARERGVEVIAPSSTPAQGRKLAPLVLVDPPDDLAVMREEIFGPLLPVKPYETLDDAIAYVNARPRPLALYIFSRSQATVDALLRRTVAGGVAVNDTLMHIIADDLPFGGVGPSGMGHYHGREGFDTFSKLKPVFARRWPGLGILLRPPYGKLQERMKDFLVGRR